MSPEQQTKWAAKARELRSQLNAARDMVETLERDRRQMDTADLHYQYRQALRHEMLTMRRYMNLIRTWPGIEGAEE